MICGESWDRKLTIAKRPPPLKKKLGMGEGGFTIVVPTLTTTWFQILKQLCPALVSEKQPSPPFLFTQNGKTEMLEGVGEMIRDFS